MKTIYSVIIRTVLTLCVYQFDAVGVPSAQLPIKDDMSHGPARAQEEGWRLPESCSNEGGSLGIGNCWWHSDFNRNVFYLAELAPQKPQPTSEEAKDIIRSIAKGDTVVEIPGYCTFREFADQYANEIKREIDQRHMWMNLFKEAARYPSYTDAPQHDVANELMRQLQNNEIPIVATKWKDDGFNAHSLMFVGYHAQKHNILFYTVNSNNPSTIEVTLFDRTSGHFYYTHDDRLFQDSVTDPQSFGSDQTEQYPQIIPYNNSGFVVKIQRNSDFKDYREAISAYLRQNTHPQGQGTPASCTSQPSVQQ